MPAQARVTLAEWGGLQQEGSDSAVFEAETTACCLDANRRFPSVLFACNGPRFRPAKLTCAGITSAGLAQHQV